MSRSALTNIIVLIFVLGGQTACVEQPVAPCAERHKIFSFPSEDPVLFVCCTEESQVLKEFFASAPSTESDPAFTAAKRIQEGLNGQESTCVRYDSLTSAQKIEAKLTADFWQTCRFVAGSHDHFLCACDQFCGDVAWNCNCPGVPPGGLPKAVSEGYPQDSLRSKPELFSETCVICPGSPSTCCD